MKYTCDYKLMGIPERLGGIYYICSQLGLCPDLDVSIDEFHNGPCWNSLNAFAMPFDEHITHRCVIQDDVDICADFADFVDILVNKFPNAIWSFFCGNGSKNKDGIEKVFTYPSNIIIPTGGTVWGQAIILPLKYLSDYVEFATQYQSAYKLYTGHKHRYDDQMFQKFAFLENIPIYTCIPYIVRHRVEEKSSMGHYGLYNSKGWCDLTSPLSRNWDFESGLSMRGICSRDKSNVIPFSYKGKEYNL